MHFDAMIPFLLEDFRRHVLYMCVDLRKRKEEKEVRLRDVNKNKKENYMFM